MFDNIHQILTARRYR